MYRLRVTTVPYLGADRHKDLADVDASNQACGLAEGTTHTGLKPIGTCARKHLVNAQHMERMHTHPQMEVVLAAVLGHVLVGADAGRLKGLR